MPTKSTSVQIDDDGRPTTDITVNRVWAMPSKDTFSIRPIKELVERELDWTDGIWVDPFCGESDYADITNDLSEEIDSDYTMEAVAFLQEFDDNEIDGGVLFDPPYSPRQIKECYESVGRDVTKQMTQSSFWSTVKDEIERICADGAVVITCGWNSGGVGKGRDFKKDHILMVPHGSWHNDTIVTVETYRP